MIFVDSNVLIFSEMAEYPEHAVAVEKLISLTKDGIAINGIVVSEVYHKLYKLIGQEEAFKRTKNILSSKSFVCLPIEKETVERSHALTKYVRINDVIIAQHAMDSKLHLLTDNVKDFKKIKGLKVIRLR